MAREFPKEHTLMLAAAGYAEAVSRVASCERARVGCVLTTMDLRIVAHGYNGVAPGMPNTCLRPEEAGNCGCVHAESNAVCDLRRSKYDGPLIAFITVPPCERCAMLLLRNDVRMVIYTGEHYRDISAGVKLLDTMAVPHGKPAEMARLLRDNSVLPRAQYQY